MTSFTVHMFLALCLFLTTNWLGKHSSAFGYLSLSMFARADEAPAFNFLFRVLTPVVFMTVAAATLYLLNIDWAAKNIYLIVPYSFVIRATFNVATSRARLVNWPAQATHLFVSTAIAWFAYDRLVSNREYLLPDADSLGNELWLGIAVFVYAVINKIQLASDATARRKQRYLEHRLDLYQMRYGDIVDRLVRNEKLKALTYAVMIYEAFNRPKFYRVLEIPLFFLGYAKTLGIMQVTTSKLITERESVELGTAALVDAQQASVESPEDEGEDKMSKHVLRSLGEEDAEDMRNQWREQRILTSILKEYNGGSRYRDEVSKLYESILTLRFPNTMDRLQDLHRNEPASSGAHVTASNS